MNLPCEIIQDLLPLYEDSVCSAQSRCAVEKHLQECKKCRTLLSEVGSVPVIEVAPEQHIAAGAIAKTFRRIRRRWWLSVVLVMFVVPIAIMVWKTLSGKGVHFGNLHELYIANAFMEDLQDRNYEAAYQRINLERLQKQWSTEWFDEEKMVNLFDDGYVEFCNAASLLDSKGGIQEYEYIGITQGGVYKEGAEPFYRVVYIIYINNTEHQVYVDVTDDGVEFFSCEGSFLDDPFAQLGMWSEYLWQSYEGCYFDPDTGEYVYYETRK